MRRAPFWPSATDLCVELTGIEPAPLLGVVAVGG
jgi:hypothetical protein